MTIYSPVPNGGDNNLGAALNDKNGDDCKNISTPSSGHSSDSVCHMNFYYPIFNKQKHD